jgi:hypothetical protein
MLCCRVDNKTFGAVAQPLKHQFFRDYDGPHELDVQGRTNVEVYTCGPRAHTIGALLPAALINDLITKTLVSTCV